MTINKIILVGRLGKDPDFRQTTGGNSYCSLNLATSEKYKDKQGNLQEVTEWHRVVLWGRTAEVARDWTRKGSLVYVEGSLRTREYNKDGEQRRITEVNAQVLKLLDGKGKSDDRGVAPNSAEARRAREETERKYGGTSRFDDLEDIVPF